MKRIFPLVEIGAVLALFFALRLALRGTTFADWQKAAFGAAPISSVLLFFVLPLAFLIVGRKNLGRNGLAAHDFRYHRRIGLRAASFLLPVTLLFPLMGLVGTTHEQWLGALMLTVGIAVAGILVVKSVTAIETRPPRAISTAALRAYCAVLVLGLVACFALDPISRVLTRVVHVLIFVAFLEEFFFRGYLQSRLNEVFGRPYQLAGVKMGVGLVVSAAVFGLLHPLTSLDGTPWPWAVWTGTGGLLFAYLREKSGSAVAPAVAHGLFLLPSVFVSS